MIVSFLAPILQYKQSSSEFTENSKMGFILLLMSYIRTDLPISLQDYFVLIPEAYYEATILTKLVDRPCVIGEKTLCREFAYPSVEHFPKADVTGLVTSVTQYIDDQEV